MLKMANIARSINDISPQVSAYIPISDPPRTIPDYLRGVLEPEWYSSALISSAMETISLPTRLRRHEDFESSLASVDGTRNIFKLQSTVLQAKPEKNNQGQSTEEGDDNEPEVIQDAMFDIDFTTNDLVGAKKPHVFSQIQVSRGWEENTKPSWNPTKDPSLSRRRQFTKSEHIVRK